MCHTVGGSGANPATGLHNMTVAGVQKHDNTLGTTGCKECHAAPGMSSSSTHMNGSYVADNNANSDRYINRTNMTWTDNDANTGTCFGSGLGGSCHSDGGSWKRLWDNAANSNDNAVGAARCNVCHGQWSSLPGSKGWRDNTSHFNVSGSFANARGKTHDAAPENCDDCHAYATVGGKHNTPTHLITMNDNITGYARGTGGDSGYAGCVQCHGGAADAGKRIPISVFGFEKVVGPQIVASCNACHSYPGGGSGAYTVTMSSVHEKHVGTTASAANSKGYDCNTCHFGYMANGVHNQTGVSGGAAWPGGYDTNVSVRFDNAMNPSPGANLPSYGGQNATTGYAPGLADNSGICASLYCHGGNPSLNVRWGGDNTAPKWDNSTKVFCGACHDANSALAQGNHQAHLVANYGPKMGNTCSGTAGCHTDYGLTQTDNHATGRATFRTSSGNATATDNAGTQVCDNCHTTYTSGNVGTSGAALGKANWDDNSYKLPCVTCHTGGSNTQATVGIDGSGNRAHNIEGTYYAKGHGDPTIDCTVTTPSVSTPVQCTACHDAAVGHIGANRPTGTNPWRLLSSTNFSTVGGLDAFCASTACHSGSPPADHTWNVANSETRATEGTDTHPVSTMAMSGSSMSRWYQVPDNVHIPLQGNLTDNNNVKVGTQEILCVSCHDPHGVAATAIPSSVRTFSGVNTEAADNNQMLRFNYKSGTPPPLCANCHK